MEDPEKINTRVQMLEKTVDTHERRISEHGKEIDGLSKLVAEIRVNDHHRDETMSRIEGKVDTLVMKPSARWEQVILVAIGAVVLYVLYQIGIHS